MKRKTEQFLRGACAFLSTVALSGCGAHPSNSNSQNGSDSANSSSGDEIKLIDQNDSSWAHDEITLRFWHGFTGADGDGMAKIVSSFNKAFAGKVNIQADKLPWDTLFSKLITSSTNPSTAPHIVAMGAARAVGMLPKNLFISMNEAPKVLGVNESDYVSSAWKAGYYGKTDRYSFPWTSTRRQCITTKR
jgi:ABC-type glycerol-3-phosphate transport system substrate-binding protein